MKLFVNESGDKVLGTTLRFRLSETMIWFADTLQLISVKTSITY